jgi:hypothetical protein
LIIQVFISSQADEGGGDKMKIIKKDAKTRTVTLRLSEEVMQKIDKLSEDNDVSRQKLIEAILEQVLEDKGFVLRIG